MFRTKINRRAHMLLFQHLDVNERHFSTPLRLSSDSSISPTASGSVAPKGDPRSNRHPAGVRWRPIRTKNRDNLLLVTRRRQHPAFNARKPLPASIPVGIWGHNSNLKISRRPETRAGSPRGAGLMVQTVNNCDYSSLMKGLGTSIDYQFKLTNNLA